MRKILLALALLPLPALAELPRESLGAPLTAGEFDAYATGKTLLYAADGAVWGTEQYLPDRQVLWAFTGEPCEYGRWYEEGGAICFVYEGNPGPNCWRFYRGSRGLVAEFIGGESSNVLSEVGQSSEPMNCPGPEVGV